MIPPRSEIDATLVISTQTYDMDWTATVLLTNCVGVGFNYPVDLDGGGQAWLNWAMPVAHTVGLVVNVVLRSFVVYGCPGGCSIDSGQRIHRIVTRR